MTLRGLVIWAVLTRTTLKVPVRRHRPHRTWSRTRLLAVIPTGPTVCVTAVRLTMLLGSAGLLIYVRLKLRNPPT